MKLDFTVASAGPGSAFCSLYKQKNTGTKSGVLLTTGVLHAVAET